MIRHIVLIAFDPSADAESIEQVRHLFLTIAEKIPGIVHVEWGINNSPEGLNKGFDYIVVVTFADEAARQLYLTHAEHRALQQVFDPLLRDIIVVDFTPLG